MLWMLIPQLHGLNIVDTAENSKQSINHECWWGNGMNTNEKNLNLVADNVDSNDNYHDTGSNGRHF